MSIDPTPSGRRLGSIQGLNRRLAELLKSPAQPSPCSERLTPCGPIALSLCSRALSLALARPSWGAVSADSGNGSSTVDPALAIGFSAVVCPLIKTYCYPCHSGNRLKGDLGFGRVRQRCFRGAADYSRWDLLAQRVEAEEMPSDEAKLYPTPAERKQLTDWIQALGADEARRHAGDPGIVLARRLSNAEYDYIDPRPDGRRYQADAGIPGGSVQHGRIRQFGRIAGHVAVPAEQVPEGGAGSGQPHVLEAQRIRLCALSDAGGDRSRQILRPADHRFLPPRRISTTPTISRPRGGSSIAPRWASQGHAGGFRRRAKVSAKYLATIWTTLEGSRRRRSARW